MKDTTRIVKYRAVMIYPIDQALSDFCVKED